MKRILAVLLAFIMFCSLVACGTQFETIDWNSIALKEQLPQPATDQGKIVTNDPNGLWIHIKAESIAEYQAYVTACKEKGFTIEANESTSSFYAYNAEGYKLSLYYTESSKEYSINVDAPRKMNPIAWPTTGIAATLPAPSSLIGEILTDGSDSFTADIGNMSKTDMDAYINLCMESGYGIDYKKQDTYFKATDMNGTELKISYLGFNIVRIELDVESASESDAADSHTDENALSGEDELVTEPDAPTEAISFEEIIVVDNEECIIKITDIEESFLWGYTLNVYTENKSAKKTYMFSLQSASVNGVEAGTFFAEEIAPGKKSNGDITFSDSDFDYNEIGKFTDILLNFRVYDSNDWMADDVAQVSVHVYPYGEENATKFAREAQPTDTILIDNEYVTIIVTGYDPDDLWGWSADMYIVNKADVSIMVSIDEASVNGYMLDPFYATSVMPGTNKFSSVSWSNSELEKNNIKEVESIEFVLRVYNEDNWFADDFVRERITLTP